MTSGSEAVSLRFLGGRLDLRAIPMGGEGVAATVSYREACVTPCRPSC